MGTDTCCVQSMLEDPRKPRPGVCARVRLRVHAPGPVASGDHRRLDRAARLGVERGTEAGNSLMK